MYLELSYPLQYREIRILGRGGCGTVYEVKDLGKGRKPSFALKVFGVEEIRDLERQLSLIEELLQTAEKRGIMGELEKAVTVPTIIKSKKEVEMCWPEQRTYYEPQYYMLMDLINGNNLRDILSEINEEDKPRKEILDYAIPILIKALEGAHILHSLGFVHGDLKEHNIIVSEDEVKLTDLDLIERIGTKMDFIIGTPQYLPPEKVSGGIPLVPSSDVYSMGVVLYRFVAGELPFTGDCAYHHLHTSPPRFEIDKRIPRIDLLQTIVDNALAKNCNERYQSALEMVRDLREYLCKVGVSEKPEATRSRIQK